MLLSTTRFLAKLSKEVADAGIRSDLRLHSSPLVPLSHSSSQLRWDFTGLVSDQVTKKSSALRCVSCFS